MTADNAELCVLLVTVWSCRYLLRPLGLEIDYVNKRAKRDHIYLTFNKPEDRQLLYHKLIQQKV